MYCLASAFISKEVKPWLRQELKRKLMYKHGKDDESSIEQDPSWELKMEKLNQIRTRKVPVPVQTNHCDCGLFVCTYAEQLINEAPGIEKCTQVTKESRRTKSEAEVSTALFGDNWSASP